MQRRRQSRGVRPRANNRKNRGVFTREREDVDNGNIKGYRQLIQDEMSMPYTGSYLHALNQGQDQNLEQERERQSFAREGPWWEESQQQRLSELFKTKQELVE